MSKIFLPGKTTIGIIGKANQMTSLILTAHFAGYKVGTFTAQNDNISQLADFNVQGSFNDQNKLQDFSQRCDVIAYTDVNLSSATIKSLESHAIVPQGTDLLDVDHDRSMQSVFLKSLHLPNLPYQTVVSIKDLQQGLKTFDYPVMLKPIQTQTLNDQQLLIQSEDDFTAAGKMLQDGSYMIQPVPKDPQYYSLIVTVSMDHSIGCCPIIRENYQGAKLTSAETVKDLDDDLKDQLRQLAVQLVTSLHTMGSCEVHFVVNGDQKPFITGLEPATNLISNIFNANAIQVAEENLRALCGFSISDVNLTTPAMIKPITAQNTASLESFWSKNNEVHLHLDPALDSRNYLLLTSSDLAAAKKSLHFN